MSSNTTSTTTYQPDIASLVGGYPTSFDLVPSAILGTAYSLNILIWAYRQARSSTRAILPLLHCFLFAVEHAIILFVRAAQAHKGVDTVNIFFVYWCQMTFAIGWISLIMAIVGFLRDLTTNATLADEGRGSIDQPDLRKKYRRAGLFSLAFLPSIIMGIAAGAHGADVRASYDISLRYASAILALVVLCLFFWTMQRLRRQLPFIDESAVRLLTCMCIILFIVPVYRLIVMYNKTPNLPGTMTPDISVPSSLSSPASKAAFYIFHLLPEVVITFMLHVTDVRATFNINAWGDHAFSDKKGVP